ncbi:MAG: PhoU domain-containing protein [Candidatus Bathyarchaeia archaeon]
MRSEIRKLQKVGYATLSVSIPSFWAKEYGLKRGDQIVFIPERDGALRLAPRVLAEREPETFEWVINADLCDEPGLLERLIVGNYVHGRDTISIISSTRLRSEHIRDVRTIMRRLIGLGIVEETSKKITLQCSVDPGKFPIDVVMRRLYVLAASMHNEAVQALIERDYDLARQVASMDDEVDMLYWLITRLLLSAQHDKVIAERIGITESLHIVGNRLITKFIESVADNARSVALNVAELEKAKDEIDKTVMNQTMRISELATKACREAIDCMTTRDLKLANSAICMKSSVEAEEQKLIDTLTAKVKDPYMLTRLRAIAFSLTNITQRGAEIAEIAMNRVLEKPSKFAESISLKPATESPAETAGTHRQR